jgi:hypothetical protein
MYRWVMDRDHTDGEDELVDVVSELGRKAQER